MITDNLRDIQSHYNNANPELIAVSKKQPDEKIDEALNAGIRVFGENRVQEAMERWTPRKPHYPDLKITPYWTATNKQGQTSRRIIRLHSHT